MCASLSKGRISEAFAAHNQAASDRLGYKLPTDEGVAVMRPTFIAETYEEAVQLSARVPTASPHGLP